jgi:hypothetical protein
VTTARRRPRRGYVATREEIRPRHAEDLFGIQARQNLTRPWDRGARERAGGQRIPDLAPRVGQHREGVELQEVDVPRGRDHLSRNRKHPEDAGHDMKPVQRHHQGLAAPARLGPATD